MKNGSDIISGYFCGNFSDVLKAVNTSRSMVKKVNYRACDIFVESHVVSHSTGKHSKASEEGKMASISLPLHVNRSLCMSFTFIQVLVDQT